MKKLLRHQLSNAKSLLIGRKINSPSFVSSTLDADDVREARKWLARSDQWSETSLAGEYELEFASWNESKFAFAFMSGRESLYACLQAIDSKPGDEVLVPGYTCVVVPNAIKYLDLIPTFVDIELETYGPSLESIKSKFRENTKAIVIHHLYGLVCRDLEKIIEFAKSKNVPVIEDCTHATGARYQSQRVGNAGDMAFYSSERSKIFCTIQGGMATTNSDFYAERIRNYQAATSLPDTELIRQQLCNVIQDFYKYKHSARWLMKDVSRIRDGNNPVLTTTKEEIQGKRPAYLGRRMPDPIAAIGISQLKKIDTYNERRRETSVRWSDWCHKNNYTTPTIIPDSEPTFLRYPVLVEPQKKSNHQWATSEFGIRPGVWFVSNLHPAPSNIPDCPNADLAVERCINFPTLIY